MKILVADDDIVTRRLLQRTLERSGFTVVCVEDGQSAVECLLEPDGPRIAILDWVMPGKDGPSVCREIRAQENNPYVYLILLTSRENREDVVKGLEAGADDYLIKPWNPEEINARVRTGQRILELQDKLTHEADHDSLTELPNRAFFAKRLHESVRRAQQSERDRFTLLFIDIDRFKTINDSLGHLAGDEVLRRVSKRLLQAVRTERGAFVAVDLRHSISMPSDVVARLGGDEFVILLNQFTDVQDGVRVAERVQSMLEPAFHIGGMEVFITVSIGISTSGEGPIHVSDILRNADLAMYRAKMLGKARYEIMDPAQPTASIDQFKLECGLRKAIHNNEFEVHYQPIVGLEDCRIHSFEALVRWRHPMLGLLQPGKFLAVAEEAGLMAQIGAIVMREACQKMCEWNGRFVSESPVAVCINVSPNQFEPLRLVDCVRQVLRDTGLDPRSLELEVTENLTMQDAARASEILRDLSSLGVSLSLDDFGTGYSSLSYLLRFPIRTLKIDRSFVAEIEGSQESRSIVQTIIALGHNLGMKVIAEGIESVAQMELLKTLGCDMGQGYLFSRPVEADLVSVMMTSRRLGGTLSPYHNNPLPKDSVTIQMDGPIPVERQDCKHMNLLSTFEDRHAHAPRSFERRHTMAKKRRMALRRGD
jgi:diguanylate cyclase (GGDEF)-like protein